ncbi:3-oxoacid CoA-transferase subunit B [Paraburkholderia silvatlantica]|uniref:3-oxoadipate CoA-transferase beta subunit n=1 Tax=Paraburkholderia silvatlantica TaxID=321895 RepID=A0ABR6FX66_9BURK|nr:3-oxoacid CoA-transferase subunit B [Paraburkholderia silvatlantica]MBB2932029.1 3-oxoadipate CoA-transferase beta subunit [Paraburkholderia silvatlantica]PVY24703.1 3-oxoadipate CoA-transferase beta subunit [Paraburkholderia silvatlantica]PXW31199.1 3-oxoadipate CoA-transferase beta subunit [Paraburkholderia silvatlantica]
MTNVNRLSRQELAQRVAQDIPDGAYVNLGIGLPTLVSEHIPSNREVIFHSENGILGMGPAPSAADVDWDLVNAGKQPVTLVRGGSYFHHADSFAMVRGRHLDLTVLGAYQVSVNGDLANWHVDQAGTVPGVGGAMDLAIGAKRTVVVMELFTREGKCKIVQDCSYPITAIGCVNRVYTDMLVVDVTHRGLEIVENFSGLTLLDLEKLVGVELYRRTR